MQRAFILLLSCAFLISCDRGDTQPGDRGVRTNEGRLMGEPWEIVQYSHDIEGDDCAEAEAAIEDFRGWRLSFDRR
ncbi:MAG: hypothetical protein MJA83_12530, partial [Gammaproteobacteria bacterium]|nr:hypothetical protein [Gammaproteobacteria bacterium]